jgi:hypothetical protein
MGIQFTEVKRVRPNLSIARKVDTSVAYAMRVLTPTKLQMMKSNVDILDSVIRTSRDPEAVERAKESKQNIKEQMKGA